LCLCLIGFSWKLSPMPDSDDPDRFFFYTVKETVRRHDNFPKREIGELRNHPAGLRKLPEPGQDLFCLVSESIGRCWVFTVNIGDDIKEWFPPRRSKKDFQGFVSFNRESASVRTASRLYPLPASISFSPRARRRKSSSSCWECS